MRLYYKRILIWLTILVIATAVVRMLVQIDGNRSKTTNLSRGQILTKFVTRLHVREQQHSLSSIAYQVSKADEHDATDSTDIGVKALISRSKLFPADSDPVLSRCPMYEEFRGIDFTHSALIRRRLCSSGVEAYRKFPGDTAYPICRLQQPFDADLMDIVRRNSELVSLFDSSADSDSIKIFAYNWPHYLSSMVKTSVAWQPNITHATLQLAMKVPDVTFLDIGCSIGIDSIRAARLGLPVVALDANIRDLLRLRLSLEAASLNADLVWNFISPDQELKYFNFPNDLCKIGDDAPAKVTKRTLVDTIPVMPLTGDKLGQLIETKNLVIKIGMAAGSADFLSLSENLFSEFTVAAVQMEWQTELVQEAELSYILEFFTTRDYTVWKLPDFRPLNPNNSAVYWGSQADIIWIHSHFIHLARV